MGSSASRCGKYGKKHRARQENSCLALSGTFRAFPRVGQRVSLEETSKIKHLKKVADYERKSPESSDSGDFWWRLLDSNQWPHACEDSIGMPSAEFWENKAGLPHDFLTRRYAFLRCFRPGFSVRGSRRGSTGDFRSCSHVTFCVAGINKTFLEKVIAFRQQLWYVLWLQKRRCRNV